MTTKAADLQKFKRIRDSWYQELKLHRQSIEKAFGREKKLYRRWLEAERNYQKARSKA